MRRKIEDLKYPPAHPGLVISDVRFENEADMIRSQGGVIVHLLGRSVALQGETASHVSEHSLRQGFDDILIDNRRDSLPDYFERLTAVVFNLRQGT